MHGAQPRTSPSWLNAEQAAAHYQFPSVTAFYEFVRRRKHAFVHAVERRGRVMLIDPVAFDRVLASLRLSRRA